MSRMAVISGALLLGALAPVAPALARVSVRQGLSVGGTPLFVTSQREIFVIGASDAPARRLGRLPRHASPLVSSGLEAWAVRTGRQSAESIQLYRVEPSAQDIERLSPRSSSVDGPIDVDGIAGADSHHVYLLPDGRFDRQTEEIQGGHLDEHPDLQVLRVHTRGERVWYLARDRRPEVGGIVQLWLLHDSFWNAHGLRVVAGVEDGPADLIVDDRDLFVVSGASRVLRFDQASLRLVEDLGPMLRGGPVDFFVADDSHYWVGTRHAGRAPDEDDESADERADRASHVLWRIERENLDGGPFHAEAVPGDFVPLGATGETLWFGALETRHATPVMAVGKWDGASRTYGIRGKHARFWRGFGRGALNVGEGAALFVIAVPFVAVAIVTLPLWIWSGWC
jgi:hypothetical protein